MSVIEKHLGENYLLIEPFERALDKRPIEDFLKDGEREIDVCEKFIHTVEYNGHPDNIIKFTIEEIEEFKKDPMEFKKKDDKKPYREKCFLWVIDDKCLKIAREKIQNHKRTFEPDYICHTNLTNCGKAYIGGEILFGDDDHFYINFFSDRYGGRSLPDGIWEATKKVFIELGYTNLVDILEL